MTYARARLWLGITGVGSLVTLSTIALTCDLPQRLLATAPEFGMKEFLQLCTVAGLFMLWLLPLDFLGGYLLPAKFQKSNQTFGNWLRRYTVARWCRFDRCRNRRVFHHSQSSATSTRTQGICSVAQVAKRN